MAATSSLPEFVVFYSPSAGKYLTFLPELDEGETGDEQLNQFVAARGGHVANPHSKFKVEQTFLHPTMVHIRSCYNNKYLQRQWEEDTWILAAAYTPEDDLTDWSSTLFLPEFVTEAGSSTTMVQLLHVQLGQYVQVYDDDSSGGQQVYSKCLRASSKDAAVTRDPTTLFQVIDWESLVTLPRQLAFKGDNGLYLGIVDKQSQDRILQFAIDDFEDRSVPHEVDTLLDGSVRISGYMSGKWKRGNDDYMRANDYTAVPTLDSLFTPIKVNDNTVALRNMGNDKLCKRYTDGVIVDGFKAMESQLKDDTYFNLMLTELVTSRTIVDIKFHIKSGSVYDTTTAEIIYDGIKVINDSDEEKTLTVEIPYTDVKTGTWRSTNSSFKLGPDVEIQPDLAPSVDTGFYIKMTAPFDTSYVWGETSSKETSEVYVKEVTVPPLAKVGVTLWASVSTCDVPFSYTRHDINIVRGGREEEIYTMEDGLYTGTNYFNFWASVSLPF